MHVDRNLTTRLERIEQSGLVGVIKVIDSRSIGTLCRITQILRVVCCGQSVLKLVSLGKSFLVLITEARSRPALKSN